MASSQFAKSLAKRKTTAKLLQKAKEAEVNSGFEIPEIEDGKYVARIKAESGQTPKKDVPFVSFQWTIVDDSPFHGKGYNQTFFLENEDYEKLEKTYERMGKSFKAILGTSEIDLETPEDIEDRIADINEQKPLVRITIKNTEWQDKRYMNTFFNERVYEDDSTSNDAVDSSDSDDTQDSAAQDVVFQKDDNVIYEAEEYVVLTSNPRNNTCTLKSLETKEKVTGVSWDDLELLTD